MADSIGISKLFANFAEDERDEKANEMLKKACQWRTLGGAAF